MKFLIFLFLIPALASALVEPKIGAHGRVELGADVTKSLGGFKAFDIKDFAPTVQGYFSAGEAPMAALADFNGDSIDDIVLMGKSGSKQLVLVAMSNKAAQKYEIHRVHSDDFVDPRKARFGAETGLSHYVSMEKMSIKGRQRPVIQLESVLALTGGIALYYWNGKAFEEYFGPQ